LLIVSLTPKRKKPPLRWLLGISFDVAVLFLYFKRSKLGGLIWQVFAYVPILEVTLLSSTRRAAGGK
jgi:hypothetical protein